MDIKEYEEENKLLILALTEALKHWERTDPYYQDNIIYKQLSTVLLDAMSKRWEKEWEK